MPLIPYGGHVPQVDSSVFIAPNAWVTGKVKIAARASLFFGVVIRGDIQAIEIGEETNIQEHCILHTSRGLQDCIVGKRVTVGHGVILHGCSVQDSCIIGMHSTILDGAEISANCIIGAHSLVTMNCKIPSGTLALGSPAKVVRDLTEKEFKELQASADSYLKVAAEYRTLQI